MVQDFQRYLELVHSFGEDVHPIAHLIQAQADAFQVGFDSLESFFRRHALTLSRRTRMGVRPPLRFISKYQLERGLDLTRRGGRRGNEWVTLRRWGGRGLANRRSGIRNSLR